MSVIFTRVEVPDHLAKDWLQHLRNFDTAHPGCHFEIVVDAVDMTMADMVDAVRINPQLDFIVKRPK